MRVIIAGSRHLMDEVYVYGLLDEALADIEVTTVLCGCAKGVDRIGANWAQKNGIPIEYYPARWRDEFGRQDLTAGPRRNRQMGENADALACIRFSDSRGSRNMVETAQELGLTILLDKVVIAEDV